LGVSGVPAPSVIQGQSPGQRSWDEVPQKSKHFV